MFLSRVQKWLASRSSRKRLRPRYSPRAQFEQLEDRTLLTGEFGSALGFGSSGYDFGRAVTTDADGNVYVAGTLDVMSEFAPEPVEIEAGSAVGSGAFVAKFSAAGDLVWARSFGETGYDQASGVAVDATGNVFVTGRFVGTADLNPNPNESFNVTSQGAFDVFVVKLTPTGTFEWAYAAGGVEGDAGSKLAVDSSGNLVVTGVFDDTVDFHPGPGETRLRAGRYNDIFVIKLNTNGQLIWARNMGGNDNTGAFDLALDGSGNVYTTGYFAKTADFDPGRRKFDLTAGRGVTAGFVSKLDSSGGFVWARTLDATGWASGNGIAVDDSENVVITGSFRGRADFETRSGSVKFGDRTHETSFVAKLERRGIMLWARGVTGPNVHALDIAIDALRAIYTTGYFDDQYARTADFDPGQSVYPLASIGGDDVFVWKLDAAGKLNWAIRFGGDSTDNSVGIAVDARGNVFTTGLFGGTVDFDPGTAAFLLTANGSADVFLSRLTQ
jgi:hypothetical protein